MRAPSRPLFVLLVVAVLALATGLAPRRADAHQPGLSRGDYAADGATVTAALTFARPELASLDPAKDIALGIEVDGDGQRCPGELAGTGLTDQDGILVRVRFTCPASPAKIRVGLATMLDSLAHGHRHMASAPGIETELIYRGHDSFSFAGITHASAEKPPAEKKAPSVVEMLRMGIEHILTGYDHLLFLFGLVVVGGRLRSLLGVITAFTVAHSITLALAALDVWSPPARIVEPAIALSIAYVGVENFFVANAEKRWRVTFPFGLIHGFGFASALRDVSLPRHEIPVALVSFNLGVEIGQLLVLAPLLPLLWLLRKVRGFERYGVKALSGVVVVAGLVLLVWRIASENAP